MMATIKVNARYIVKSYKNKLKKIQTGGRAPVLDPPLSTPGSTYKLTFIEELCTVYNSSYLTSSSPNVYIYIYMIPMFIYIQVSKGLWSVLHSDIHYMLSARINIVIASC